MTFRYNVKFADGDDAGEIELDQQAHAGEEIHLAGNRPVRILAIVPTERTGEFVGLPIDGLLEVEPFD